MTNIFKQPFMNAEMPKVKDEIEMLNGAHLFNAEEEDWNYDSADDPWN